MDKKDLKDFLEEKYLEYNTLQFIQNDPVSVPHQFSIKEDIEIAGFLAASLAWGQRVTIINKCNLLLGLMDNAPFEFLRFSKEHDLKRFYKFIHRTFNGDDCFYFIKALKLLYVNHGGISKIINKTYAKYGNLKEALTEFRKLFLSFSPLPRTGKHVANVQNGAGGKRLNMFLRWMVRTEGPVDFGIWEHIPTSALFVPLDLHTGNVSRKLGLLTRKQDDWRAVEELTENLRLLDKKDPVKYDFALFGLGVNENF